MGQSSGLLCLLFMVYDLLLGWCSIEAPWPTYKNKAIAFEPLNMFVSSGIWRFTKIPLNIGFLYAAESNVQAGILGLNYLF
jgi:hypothetical protein